MAQATAPYEIQRFPGAGGRQVPFKCYPNGIQIVATDEEVQVWEAYQASAGWSGQIVELKSAHAAQVAELETKVAELELQIQDLKAEKPKKK